MNQKPASLGWAAKLAFGALLAGSAGALYFATTAALADVTLLQARWQITQWQKTPQLGPTAIEWGQARNALVAAQRWTPGEGQIYENLGYLYALRAISSRGIPELEQAMLAETIGNYRAAVTRRPMSPYAWANLALALYLKGSEPALMWQAYDRAYLYGQKERSVLQTLGEIGFKHWDTAGEVRQSQLLALVANALESHRELLRAAALRHGRAKVLAP